MNRTQRIGVFLMAWGVAMLILAMVSFSKRPYLEIRGNKTYRAEDHPHWRDEWPNYIKEAERERFWKNVEYKYRRSK